MILLRSLFCPTWRCIAYTMSKNVVRRETSTFSNIKESLSYNRLIFEYKDRILPIVGGFGLLQFIAFDCLAYWSFYLFGTVTAKPENITTDSTLLERAATIVPTNRFRYTTNIVVVLLSGAIFAASIIYPARCIRRLYLLKDGSSVGIVTYAFWPSARKFIVPLENVSAETALKGAGIFHKIRIRNHRLSHLINKKEGKFYDENLYETIIALKRF